MVREEVNVLETLHAVPVAGGGSAHKIIAVGGLGCAQGCLCTHHGKLFSAEPELTEGMERF